MAHMQEIETTICENDSFAAVSSRSKSCGKRGHCDQFIHRESELTSVTVEVKRLRRTAIASDSMFT
jgi:hypothetical protein